MSIYEIDAELHEKTVKDMAYEAGEKAGRETGDKIGRIMAFHEVGLSVSDIAKRVGITEDEVQGIISGR